MPSYVLGENRANTLITGSGEYALNAWAETFIDVCIDNDPTSQYILR
jgi:hypothetical protein